MNATLYTGDALGVLRSLPDGVARCCVTSPPYWGLRDYGTATWEGGDAGCDHKQGTARNDAANGRHNSDSFHGSMTTQHGGGAFNYKGSCGKCGAIRGDSQLGLEPTPDAYVSRMVEVFREVRRVLTEDGTLWLNLGDSYAGSANAGGDESRTCNSKPNATDRNLPTKRGDGLKPKDLVGIPWSVAFALRADGWYLRSEIIWAKSNPMPESVTDRPTKAHEQLFLLSKQPRYYYDAAAIAEPFADERMGNPGGGGGYVRRVAATGFRNDADTLGSGVWNADGARSTRNARTVWTINTQPYPGAHFATFPEELPRRCILAGSAPGDTVLDPFSGSGTTAAVAVGNGRSAIGIELNPKYQELARQRIGPMLCTVAA